MSIKDNILDLWHRKRPDIKSIAELERKIDLSNGIISQWEKGTPSAKSVKKVATFFDVSVDCILGKTHTHKNYSEDREFREMQARLFREATEDQSLTSEEKNELKDDIGEYLKLRTKILRERNAKKGRPL